MVCDLFDILDVNCCNNVISDCALIYYISVERIEHADNLVLTMILVETLYVCEDIISDL